MRVPAPHPLRVVVSGVRSTLPALAILTIGALALSGCAGRAAPPVAGPPTPTRELLPNGIVLIVGEHRASDVVALQLWMRVGGRDEAPEELGLSHYLEHMLFKGTATRPPGSIDLLIEGFGGTSNAFTSYDYTHFDVVVPAPHVRAGIELLADIAVNASFPPEEIDRERQVVFEEMRLLEDDPDKFMQRRVSELASDGHPYGRPILGTRRLIGALDRPRLERYYKTHYVAPAMALVVVGAVTPSEVRPIVAATFGRLGGRAEPRDVPTMPPIPPSAKVDVRRPEKQAYLGLGWQAPSVSGPDSYAVDLLTSILGDSPSSRLNRAVREGERLVYSIDASYLPRQKGGLVSITAQLEVENLDKAEASILAVIERVKAEGVTEAERQRAIITAESTYAFDIETAEGLAKDYGQAETTWTLENELAYLGRLRQVSAAEIQAAARTYFGGDNYARVRLVPGDAR